MISMREFHLNVAHSVGFEVAENKNVKRLLLVFE